ncbi:hypothetical protein [Streptomyces sp. NPDC001070]
MNSPRRVAIPAGNRIPFARADGPCATASHQDMLLAAKLLAERGGPSRGPISVFAAGGQGVTAILERP